MSGDSDPVVLHHSSEHHDGCCIIVHPIVPASISLPGRRFVGWSMV